MGDSAREVDESERTRAKASSSKTSKTCAACGKTCRGLPRWKYKDSNQYYHYQCPRDDAGSDATVLTPRESDIDREWSRPTRRSTRKGRRVEVRESRGARARLARNEAEPSTSGDGSGSTALAFVDGIVKAIEEFDARGGLAKRALTAASATYVAGAFLLVLPSSILAAVSVFAIALRAAVTAAIIIAAVVFIGAAVARRVSTDEESFKERFAQASRAAKALAKGVVAASGLSTIVDAPMTPERVGATSRLMFDDPLLSETPETPRLSPPSAPSPRERAEAEQIRRLAQEKREAEQMLEEASVTIEFLRDALQSVDDARASDRARVSELERKLARESRSVQKLSRRVAASERERANAEPWMLDPN